LCSPKGKPDLSAATVIRPYGESDAAQVRELFVAVNRLLAPPHMRDAFEAYIARSLTEEMRGGWANLNSPISGFPA